MFLGMLYITVKISTLILIYKLIHIGPYIASASTLIMPIWFMLGDIIAEVYGYTIAKNMIWMALVCQCLFAVICTGMIHVDNTLVQAGFNHQEAYMDILGSLPRVTFASCVAILAGAFLNAFAVSRWKILLKGRYFWLRSLGASAVGEFVFTFIAYFAEFFGKVPTTGVIKLMLISYGMKLILNPILVIPASFVAFLLKLQQPPTEDPLRI
jgi:uncharacterized integral membrane protein (TIGR00697 family)